MKAGLQRRSKRMRMMAMCSLWQSDRGIRLGGVLGCHLRVRLHRLPYCRNRLHAKGVCLVLVSRCVFGLCSESLSIQYIRNGVVLSLARTRRMHGARRVLCSGDFGIRIQRLRRLHRFGPRWPATSLISYNSTAIPRHRPYLSLERRLTLSNAANGNADPDRALRRGSSAGSSTVR